MNSSVKSFSLSYSPSWSRGLASPRLRPAEAAPTAVEWRGRTQGTRAPVGSLGSLHGGPTWPGHACWRQWPSEHRRQQHTAVQADGKETQRAQGDSRNTKAKLVGTKERWRIGTTWRQGAQPVATMAAATGVRARRQRARKGEWRGE